jgi:hypothetical protein
MKCLCCFSRQSEVSKHVAFVFEKKKSPVTRQEKDNRGMARACDDSRTPLATRPSSETLLDRLFLLVAQRAPE